MVVSDILNRLDEAEKLARAATWQQVLKNPSRYAQAQWHRKVDYPRTHIGMHVDTPTVFGDEMKVTLPAGMDVYLFGAKVKDAEFRLARLLCRELNPGNTFIDVGAHFGYFSGLSAKLVGPSGTVISCEAVPSTFALLEQNLSIDSNTTAHHLAIAAERGILTVTEASFDDSEFDAMSSSLFDASEWRSNSKPAEVGVPAISLDELIGESAADFIRIDADGAEDVVIAGMSQLLSRTHVPMLCMDYLTSELDNTAHLEAISILEAAGLHTFEISESGEMLPSSIAAIDDHLRRQEKESEIVIFAPT